MLRFRHIPVVLAAVLALGSAPAWAFDAEDFLARLDAAQTDDELDAALRRLDALVVEADQAGRTDLQLLASQAHASLKIRHGRLTGAQREVEDALTQARQAGLGGYEAALGETYAEYWLAQGDPLAAAEWFQRSFRLALAQKPAQVVLARRLASRSVVLHQSVGHHHLAAQAQAWLDVLDDTADAPSTGVTLQPSASATQVVSNEVARTRLYLANASAEPVTGALLVDAGELAVTEWKSRGDREELQVRFPGGALVPDTASQQGRKITLQPGEARLVTLEVDPAAPPQVTQKRVTVTWQTGKTSLQSTVDFHFRRPRDLAGTSVSNSCRVQLSPLVSVPVHTEIYHRKGLRQHLQDIMPATSAPCRVELYEVLPGTLHSRELLAVDADGDGSFDGPSDDLAVDRNRDRFPDVLFSDDKAVVALELRLYPLDPAAGPLDLTVSLKEGTAFREPPDSTSRVETAQ